MKALGLFIFLLGMFVFTSGWLLLDLASLQLKNDLYSLDVLGFFNNLFSINPTIASFQSFMCVLFIIMGCLMCYSGSIMIVHRR